MMETKQTSKVVVRRRGRRSRQEWSSVIDSQASSGLSAKAFCQRESIGLASFYQWRGRLSKESRALDASPPKESSFIDIGRFEGPGGDTPEVGGGFELTLELGGGLSLVLKRS